MSGVHVLGSDGWCRKCYRTPPLSDPCPDDAPRDDPQTVTCPQCDGAGLLTECANDGTHGCSHTNDREWQCPLCREYGAVTAGAAREYLDELAAEAAAEAELRALRAAARPVTTVRDVAAWGPEPF